MEKNEMQTHFRLIEPQKRALTRLGINTIRDLLYHFPARYERSGDQKTVAGLEVGTDAILYGTLRKPETRKSWKSKRPMSEAWLEDGTGKVKLMWFNQPYIAKMYTEGMMVKVTGRVEGGASPYIANPEVERVSTLPLGGTDSIFQTGDSEDELFAVYSESKGITSRWFRHAISKVFAEGIHGTLDDPIPAEVLERYNLPTLLTALFHIHTPKNENNYRAARKRFAFEEVFVIQIAKQRDRKTHDAAPTLIIEGAHEKAHAFLAHLPFAPTQGQQAAIRTILDNLSRAPAMSRLLEGDVGSGKTAVAATTAYAVVTSSPKNRPSATLQVAYMAPTEILAEQHFASFTQLFGHLPIQMALMTGTVCRKYPSKLKPGESTKVPKTQLLKWIANGEIAILIGTHSLIQKKVQFRDLAYVIIDEQHRFGTMQRKALVRKDGIMPHLLSMTATPIPRTLALTLYGDLDLTVLDEMPPGRKPIMTTLVGSSDRTTMYESVRRELNLGRQAYVICPRIDEPDPTKEMAVQTRSVLAEAEQLRLKEFKGYRVGVLHGQMKPAEKDTTMRAFLAHEIDILVATSVVEVGVNVPNATSIIIEGAERFGLAQLHQLRGRVVRSNHQAYCYVLTSSGKPSTRLKALEKAKSGFELAEHDLQIRGPGELYGRSQSGITDLGMEALKNLKMVEAARTEALRLVTEDTLLSAHPILAQAVAERSAKLHFE